MDTSAEVQGERHQENGNTTSSEKFTLGPTSDPLSQGGSSDERQQHTINSRYLKVKIKLLISQSKFFGPRKFTFEISVVSYNKS